VDVHLDGGAETIEMHIKKKDLVQVVAGAGAKKKVRGEVLRLIPERGRAIVAGVKFIKRHTKANPQKGIKGGIVEREASIDVSNLMVVCRECDRPVRVRFKVHADGSKSRACHRCGKEL
jgi:large subunit ribosomal protein L24